MTKWLELAARRIANSLPIIRVSRRFDGFRENRFSERGMLAQAFEFVRLNGIPGDYLEFGLWRGRTFLHARRMRKLYGLEDMHLWGFDSFQGLPEPKPEVNEIWSQGQFACSYQEFLSILSAHGVQHTAMAGRKAAIVYIDCDLYESTVPVLDFINQYLSDGTIVCFDDYYCYAGRPDQGEQRALGEFLDKNPNISFQRYLTYCPVGQSFIVQRKSR